eukprot:CAMPEP_0175072456 /NCGR_PEP_ID=MMETSP0052_2-20121109/19924_1 /TAXON_ID=51329 ORGANISM="Polytomella parva, Strain SAG 63-3" /NCGR_SAMPLE_ID=MMETSP0052_2 /ASSEMBLY_ACC=CAM_ASM_000194 /LENGTH=431 /DNA_ID=CAMNT_0016339971 /DNA_START=54 /DNA_END=1346 /DNA_ORIENTATION=+
MISQFYMLSPRGDVVIRKDYLGDVPKNSSETFFRNYKFWKEGDEAPPVFNLDGVTYLHIKEGGVQLVATTRSNMSPSFVLEFLKRISVLIKDYCGILSEEAVRKNFVLIYELLDEVIDYGMPQSTSTESLKSFVLNEPIVLSPQILNKSLFSISKGPTGVFKSILETNRVDGKRRDEIYVDVVERLTCTFNASGYVSTSQIDGSVQIKSYLAGNPPLKIKFNDNLIVGKRDMPYGVGDIHDTHSVILDDCNFHEVANLESFDLDRTISLVPPDGEFALINYRTSRGFKPPFRLYVGVESDGEFEFKAGLSIRLWCEIPIDKAASGLEVEIPLPRYVQRVSCDIDAKQSPIQSYEFSEKTHVLKWKFKKCQGGSEFVLRARLTLEKPFVASLRSEVGPVNLKFTIPMYSASRIALKYLQILRRDAKYNPYRW